VKLPEAAIGSALVLCVAKASLAVWQPTAQGGRPARKKIAHHGWRVTAAVRNFDRANDRLGSFATGSIQQQVRPCPLCRRKQK